MPWLTTIQDVFPPGHILEQFLLSMLLEGATIPSPTRLLNNGQKRKRQEPTLLDDDNDCSSPESAITPHSAKKYVLQILLPSP